MRNKNFFYIVLGFSIGFLITIVYVVAHFVLKFW